MLDAVGHRAAARDGVGLLSKATGKSNYRNTLNKDATKRAKI